VLSRIARAEAYPECLRQRGMAIAGGLRMALHQSGLRYHGVSSP
jgi:hypothetical protein